MLYSMEIRQQFDGTLIYIMRVIFCSRMLVISSGPMAFLNVKLAKYTSVSDSQLINKLQTIKGINVTA